MALLFYVGLDEIRQRKVRAPHTAQLEPSQNKAVVNRWRGARLAFRSHTQPAFRSAAPEDFANTYRLTNGRVGGANGS